MRRTRKVKGIAGVVMASCLVVGGFPVVDGQMGMINGLMNVKTVYGASQSNPLDTVASKAEIGEHSGTGSYVYDANNKKITITGAGSKFDKDGGNDNLFYSYFATKGDITVTAKIKVISGSGQAGILVRNSADPDEAGSISAALYADMGKGQIRYGYHRLNAGGGANSVNNDITPGSEDIYVKMEVVAGNATYYVSSTPDFTAETTKSKTQSIADLDAKAVGFYATEGVTAEFSEVKITSKYTSETGGDVTKIVFDSETGELVPQASNSSEYSGIYESGASIDKSVDGNILTVTQTRPPKKGNIREDKSFDYMLFPKTTEDMTISADITVLDIDSGTDKQGLSLGQYSAVSGTAMECDVIHLNKNLAIQHTYTTEPGSGNCGDPKGAFVKGASYNYSYSKSGSTITFNVTAADGTKVIDSKSYELGSGSASVGAGEAVSYGMGFSGIKAEISNLTLKNAAGEIVYDMNDYYIATGVAPVISSAAAQVSDDRTAINLQWENESAGSGNIKYLVYVSKNDGAYELAGQSKVGTYAYMGMTGDGDYKFKIVPFGGDTQGVEVTTAAVTYQQPLDKTTVTVEATSKQASLTWTEVDGADSYDVYRKLGSDGTYELIKNTAETSYTDTAVKKEEPYYYYVVAKNANNTSNPSDLQQVLMSDGHTGEYSYENEDVKVNVVSKSNDTVFDSKGNIVLTADKDGTAELYVNGSLTDTKLVTANEKFNFDINLIDGRNDVIVIVKSGDIKIRKVFSFVNNPHIDIVVDSSYTGTDGDSKDGYPTYKTVSAAVASVPMDNDKSKVIFIKNGEYEERVVVNAPNVSLLGEDSIKTHLFYSVCVANGNADSIWNRNAMYVDSTADGFTAENLTIENSYPYKNQNNEQADALCIVADKTICRNVRIVGYQDTLLTDTRVKDETGIYEVTRQYFDKCYITGNVDFIYGSGTSYFNDCDIVARYTSYKADGCYSAGKTYITTEYGYVFNNCRFLAEEGVASQQYRMARPWGKDDSTTFINCYMGRSVIIQNSDGKFTYGDMSGNLAANARFAEYGTYGPGYVLDASRPLLSSEQAKNFSAAKVMGDFAYQQVMDELYKAPQDTIDNSAAGEGTKGDSAASEDATGKEAAGQDVKTGDISRPAKFGGLMSLSFLALGAAIIEEKRKNKKKATIKSDK